MKRRRHTPEQVVRKLREADRLLVEGRTIPEVAKTLEVSENTFHRWRAQYGGMKADDVKVVHEFATALTTQAKREANKKALAQFIGDVTGTVAPAYDQWLIGPFHVPSARWSRIPLFIGHLTTPE